jgi:hypothetical protein
LFPLAASTETSVSKSESRQHGLLESPLTPLPPPTALTLSPFCLAQSDAPLLTIGDEKALLSYVAQDTLSLHRFSKALQQLLL